MKITDEQGAALLAACDRACPWRATYLWNGEPYICRFGTEEAMLLVLSKVPQEDVIESGYFPV